MIRPLRIVHASAYFAPAYAFGGPPRSLLALCRAQTAAGLDVEMFTTTANPGHPLAPAPGGCEFEGVRARYFPLSAPAMLLGARTMAPALAAALERADVVHVHGLFNRTAWMAARLSRRAGVPLVVSPRGMLEPAALTHHRWRKRLAWIAADAGVMRTARVWHASSPLEAATLRARNPNAPVVEIPNCVDAVRAGAGDVEGAKRLAGVPADAPYVLFLGRIHPIKRLDLVARAFADVAGRHPRAHLVLAGPDEGGYQRVVGPFFEPLGKRIHWCGEVDARQKWGLLAGATALVACSDSESFGMSIAESLAAGVPVVATHTCPWPELEAARCGHWVPQTAEAIADGLHGLLHDPDEGRALGERGRALIASRYSPAVVGDRWRQVYREIVAGGSGRGRSAA